MKTTSHNKADLINGYLKGHLTDKEEAELSNWIQSSEENYQIFKRQIKESQFNQLPYEEADKAWVKLKSKIDQRESVGKAKRFYIPNSWKVAAVILVALLSGFFANQFVHTTSHSASLMNEVVIPNGEKAQLILSDGTQVTLNAGTNLRYPSSFSSNERKVILVGEAFFEVAKDRSHPFVIETPKFDVRVIGTSFNLATYTNDAENSLTLYSGEVTVKSEEKEYKIRPGEKLKLNTSTNKYEIEQADLDKARLWTEGVIVIDNLHLEEIRKILERKFDVKIEITDEAYKEIRYSGQFKPHETLNDILNLIKETSPVKFNYKINEEEKKVTIE